MESSSVTSVNKQIAVLQLAWLSQTRFDGIVAR